MAEEKYQDLMEAQLMQSQIEYYREEIEGRKSRCEPYDDLSQRMFSAITRLNQLLAGI